jgi:hypothetical protein
VGWRNESESGALITLASSGRPSWADSVLDLGGLTYDSPFSLYPVAASFSSCQLQAPALSLASLSYPLDAPWNHPRAAEPPAGS